MAVEDNTPIRLFCYDYRYANGRAVSHLRVYKRLADAVKGANFRRKTETDTECRVTELVVEGTGRKSVPVPGIEGEWR